MVLKAFLATTCLLLPHAAAAQDLAPRWAETGRFEVTLGDRAATLLALDDLEGARDFVEVRDIGGFTTITATGAAIGADGTPERPYLTVMIGPYGSGAPATATVEWRGADGILAANRDTGLTVALSGFSLGADGRLSFAFDGAAVPATSQDGMLVPVADGQPVPVSGSFEGEVPPG